jgi:transposase
MAKYSEALKLKIVQEYLDGGTGYNTLACKYDVKSKTQIQNWVAMYRRFGAEGLSAGKTREVYSASFKLEVLDYMRQTGASFRETALHFGIKNPPMIASWNTAFMRGGAAALERRKGRPPLSAQAHSGMTGARGNPAYSKSKTVSKTEIT